MKDKLMLIVLSFLLIASSLFEPVSVVLADTNDDNDVDVTGDELEVNEEEHHDTTTNLDVEEPVTDDAGDEEVPLAEEPENTDLIEESVIEETDVEEDASESNASSNNQNEVTEEVDKGYLESYFKYQDGTTSNAEHEMFMLGWGNTTGDPDDGIMPMFHSDNIGSSGNRSFFQNETLDALLDEAARETDEDVRQELYEEATALVVDQAPVIFVRHGEYLNAISNNVEGLVIDNYNIFDFREASFID